MNYCESYPGEFKAVTHYITVAKCENSQTSTHSVCVVHGLTSADDERVLQEHSWRMRGDKSEGYYSCLHPLHRLWLRLVAMWSHDLESQHIHLKQQRLKCQPAQSSRWHFTRIDSLSMCCYIRIANPISVPLCYCCFIYTFSLGDQSEHHCHLCWARRICNLMTFPLYFDHLHVYAVKWHD